ncbi:protein kinase C theta type-like [Dendropsophus ebraccatus]|uniref:protein kinase C theta type-like n=1 Tax=Dendropsophus ebraccatus TaxID=150705 RepID=UPI0038318FCB
MASTGHGEEKKRKDGKRKREEEEESGAGLEKIQKRRRGLEDEKTTSSQLRQNKFYNFSYHFILYEGIQAALWQPCPLLPIATSHSPTFLYPSALVVLASVPGRKIYMAIKIIAKKGDNEEVIKRERRILQASRDCPFTIITEYLSSGSLEGLIRMCGYLDIGNVRDLKPENIMVDADGHICVIDLGLAEDGVTASRNIGEMAGTFHYMAPEVLLRRGYGAAVDWWSLGIVLSRMASEHLPFYNGPVMQQAFKAMTTEKPKFPTWLDADGKHLIKKLLRKNPEERLGVCGNIRQHPFFTNIGWKELEERRVTPPWKPMETNLQNQDLQWPEDNDTLHPRDDFNYMSPSWTRWMRRSRL